MILLGLAAAFSGLSVLFFVKKGIGTVIGAIIPALCVIAVFLQPKDIIPKWINKCEGKGTYTVRLLDFIEGITTTASVHQYSDGSTVISTAGVNVAGDALPLRQTQKMQGHFPIIMHGNTKSVLTVGFGTGELTKTLTYHNIPDITCVEISPEMVRLSRRYFSGINLGGDLEKHVRMVYMDAKNFMHLTNKKFDVIENDCVWPGTFAESSSLYTREYFLDARRCLNDSGLFSTWLTLDLPETTLFSIIKTFSSVFENTLFVYPNYAPDRHILLVGQKNAHAYSYLDAKEEFDKQQVKESLSLIGISDLNDLLGSILADYSSLDTLSGNAAINSDYFPFVEFDMNRAHLIDDKYITWKNLETILRKTRRVDYNRLLSFTGLDSAAQEETRGKLAMNEDANDYLLESFCRHSAEERLSLVNKGLTIAPQNQGLLRMRQMLTGNR
jgi:spermidine synthase